MFTCPSPGIQIGSCMRSTPGATSVTSSDAGSCSCRGGRAGAAAYRSSAAGYPRSPRRTGVAAVRLAAAASARECERPRIASECDLVYAMGANLGHGRLASASAPHARTSSSSWRRVTTWSPTGSPSGAQPTGMLTAGHARDVERRGVRHRTHAADRLPGDLERRRPFGDERGRRGRRREQQVDLVEHRRDRGEQLVAAAQRAQHRVDRGCRAASRSRPRRPA